MSGYKNEELQEMPMKEEVRSAVVWLNQHKASGPDGMTRVFYQSAWEIIGDDTHKMAMTFFCGAELTRFIIHMNFVLILKKNGGWHIFMFEAYISKKFCE